MAIGVFDSGLGGLTVHQAIAARLPDLPLVYLGDNAHAPYGVRTADDIFGFSHATAVGTSPRGTAAFDEETPATGLSSFGRLIGSANSTNIIYIEAIGTRCIVGSRSDDIRSENI